MTKKQIRKLVLLKVKEGKSQQEIFEEIKQQVRKPANEIAQLVRNIATLKNRDKYKVPHAILVLLLSVIVLFKLIAGVLVVLENGWSWWPMIFIYPFLNILITYGILTYKGAYFRFAIVLMSFGLIGILLRLFTDSFEPIVLIDVVIAASIIGLCLYLNKNMFPDFKTIKEKYNNTEGKTRLRLKITFNE